MRYYLELQRGQKADEMEVQTWLRNGWNTEMLLRQNLGTLNGDGLRNSLQWAFPQAYYSVYAVVCAFFAAVGFTESSHAAVIRKLGKQVLAKCYPASLAFAADGGSNRVYVGLGQCNLPSPLTLDLDVPANVDTHIRRFLNATRDVDLKLRRQSMRESFRTRRGSPRRKLRPADWDLVSDRLGPTSLLSLLYRKRIKANYRDIKTFLCADLDARQLYEDLIQVVKCLNFTHEAFIARALGDACLDAVAKSLIPHGHRFLAERLEAIRSLEA